MKALAHVFLSVFLLAAAVVQAQTISAVTENALFSYEKDGKATGEATVVVETVLQRAGLKDYQVNIYPWARAYSLALHQPNVLIYLIARTPEREALFKWVGEVVSLQVNFYKLKERKDITVHSLADAKKYTVGVLRDEVRHQYLQHQGFPKLELASQHIDNLRKLEHHRIDMIPMPEQALAALCKKFGNDCSKLEKVYTLEDLNVKLYIAYSKATTDDIVEKTKAALAQIRAEGTLDKIMRNKQ